MEFLKESFAQNSVLWILISSIIGGIIGASIKFIFEQVFTPRLLNKRTARTAIKKYSYPILRNAESLIRAIELLINNYQNNWYETKDDDYYKTSLLYRIGCFFAWVKILEDEAFLEYETTNKDVKKFNEHFYNVLKSISSFYYFNKLIEDKKATVQEIEKTNIPRLVITAIGELMITGQDSKKTLISFNEFHKKIHSEDFSKWFNYLDNIFNNISSELTSIKINRLVLLAINLKLLIYFLDKKGIYTERQEGKFISLIENEVKLTLSTELKDMNHLKLKARNSFISKLIN